MRERQDGTGGAARLRRLTASAFAARITSANSRSAASAQSASRDMPWTARNIGVVWEKSVLVARAVRAAGSVASAVNAQLLMIRGPDRTDGSLSGVRRAERRLRTRRNRPVFRPWPAPSAWAGDERRVSLGFAIRR